MLRIIARLLVVLLSGLVLIGCGESEQSSKSPSGDSDSSNSKSTTGKRISINGNEALTWGDGPYGAVLTHGAAFDAASWEKQATAIAEQGATVIAVESIEPKAINDAVTHLKDDGITHVALIGGSAGADAILDLASRKPKLPDQLILLSPNATVDGLSDEPKLFIASKGEPVADVSTKLADTAPGDRNKATILPGSAHAQNIFDTDQAKPVLDAMLQRLKRFSTS